MRLYNTLTRSKEEFTPMEPGVVRMYVCGITAYDYCHVGHARSAIVFDVLVRWLRRKGFDVTLARNFTDIDDKIIARANELGEASDALAERFIQAFHEDMDALGVIRADIEPKATEHIDEMVVLIETLIDKGFAYATPSGDVYYRVRAFPEYGKLSGRDIEAMRSGARVAPGEEKEDPLDFALWKAAKPGEPSWESPWGAGRPGWHTECSAMSEKLFPLPMDIHGGGQDLIFPHHENEIAQSEAATGKAFVRYWAHNGFVQVDAEKMSKSLGNFKTIRDILEHRQPETLRYLLVTKHYRSPIDFTVDALDEAEKNLKRVYTLRQEMAAELDRKKRAKNPLPETFAEELTHAREEFTVAMDDDCNTAGALGHVFTMVKLAGRLLDDTALRKTEAAGALFREILDALDDMGDVLGVFQQNPEAFLQRLKETRLARRDIDPAVVEARVAQRAEAKKAKDFEKADALRQELTAMGVEVRDTPQGPVWDVL